jgi:hypothetical protein
MNIGDAWVILTYAFPFTEKYTCTIDIVASNIDIELLLKMQLWEQRYYVYASCIESIASSELLLKSMIH